MIYKPTVLSPDKITISVGNTLTLTAQVQSGSALELVNESGTTTPMTGEDNDGKYSICYATIILRINNRDYVLPFNEATFRAEMGGSTALRSVYGKVYKEKHSLKVKFDLDMNSAYFGKCIYGKNYKVVKNIVLGEIMRNTGQYAWKVRLYSKGSITGTTHGNSDINFGAINNIQRNISESEDNPNTKYECLVCSPHVNIYTDVLNGWSPTASKTELNEGTKATLYNILRYQEDNLRYWLSIGGQYYPIYDYRLYDSNADTTIKYVDRGKAHNWSKIPRNFDGYGNPINGYMYVLQDIISDDIVEVDADYKITCNYIDSAYAYFDVEDEPTIIITENRGNEIGADNSEISPYVLNYANLKLNVEYSQSNNVDVNYYNYKVYRYRTHFGGNELPSDSAERNYILTNDGGEFYLEYASGNYYNQEIRCEYDKFFNKGLYRIRLTITDTMQRVHERDLYFYILYTETAAPACATAEYYRDHNSVIVDWGDVTSILPEVSGGYKYVTLADSEITDGIEANALLLESGSTLKYNTGAQGQELDIHNDATLALRFKAVDATQGTIALLSLPDNDIVVDYDGQNIHVVTKNKLYTYELYGNISYTASDLETELKQESGTQYKYPWIMNDISEDIEWDDDMYWRDEDRLTQGEWILVANNNSCVLKQYLNDSVTEYSPIVRPYTVTNTKLNCLILSGAIMFDAASVINSSDSAIIDAFSDGEFKRYNETVLLADFAGNLNGAEYDLDLANVVGYRIYKTFGGDDTMHEVGVFTDTNYTVLEDFVVGDNVDIRYHIYYLVKSDDNDELYYISSAVKTNSITLDDAADSLFGLVPLDEDERVYAVDRDTVWVFRFELDDGGWTMNNDKTFYDTLARYNQESIGNRAYITKSVSALIGKVDCESGGKYSDTYDMLVTWLEFVKSAQPKCFVDLRGLVLPGNFEAGVTGEYLQGEGFPCVTKFTWRQKADLNIISIHGTPLPYNPIHYDHLISDDEYSMIADDDLLLYGER